jgi:hypothetical protein
MKLIKVGRLRWLEQLSRMQEQNPCKKLILHKPEGTRRAGRSAIRWLDSVEENGRYKSETKVTGSGRKKSNSGRGQGSSWTVAPLEQEEEEEEEEEPVIPMLNTLSLVGLQLRKTAT